LVDALGCVLVAAAGRVFVGGSGWILVATAGWAGAAGYWSSQAADALAALPAKCSNPENAANDIGDLYFAHQSELWRR
jgi:hypothetical protein